MNNWFFRIKNDCYFLKNPSPTEGKDNETKTEMTTVTADIVKEFTEIIETDKVYDLKELKQVLSEIYKTKTTGKPKPKKTDAEPKKPKKAAKDDMEVDAKPKRAPTAYNLFIKQRIAALKDEQPDVPPKQRLTVAASEWKKLTKAEQESYKQ